MKKVIIVITTYIVITGSLLAGERPGNTEPEFLYWFTFGLNPSPESLEMSYNFKWGNNYYKVGYFTREGDKGSSIWSYKLPEVAIGRMIRTEWFQTSGFVGLSYIMGRGSERSFRKIGLTTNIQLLVRIAYEIGIGCSIYSNLNTEKSFNGINLNITIGN